MQFSGYLSEYSLAEIFNFVHEGDRTGLLTLCADRKSTATVPPEPQYLWFERGRIVAVTTGFKGSELLTKIGQRKLMTPDQIQPVGTMLSELTQPLGIYLKSQNLLDAIQLKLLFNSQTIVPICRLFEVKNRQFQLDLHKLPQNSELTGISLTTRELGLMGLRLLKDWSGLSAKLPDPNYAIQRCSAQPEFELNRHELQLWKLADGKTPLTQLAVKMSLSIDIVRQISFRLSTFRSLQEIPTSSVRSIDPKLSIPILEPKNQPAPMSTSFLGNLKNFLKIGREKSTSK
jgi:Domain of unknown function (DUF4388)